MTDRITLTQDVYMKVGGQPTIVLSGSVIDVPSAAAFHISHATVMLNTGTLLNGVHNNPVSGLRTR